jgi:hypothetical protein
VVRSVDLALTTISAVPKFPAAEQTEFVVNPVVFPGNSPRATVHIRCFAQPDDVLAWYRAELPRHGWILDDARQRWSVSIDAGNGNTYTATRDVRLNLGFAAIPVGKQRLVLALMHGAGDRAATETEAHFEFESDVIWDAPGKAAGQVVLAPAFMSKNITVLIVWAIAVTPVAVLF